MEGPCPSTSRYELGYHKYKITVAFIGCAWGSDVHTMNRNVYPLFPHALLRQCHDLSRKCYFKITRDNRFKVRARLSCWYKSSTTFPSSVLSWYCCNDSKFLDHLYQQVHPLAYDTYDTSVGSSRHIIQLLGSILSNIMVVCACSSIVRISLRRCTMGGVSSAEAGSKLLLNVWRIP